MPPAIWQEQHHEPDVQGAPLCGAPLVRGDFGSKHIRLIAERYQTFLLMLVCLHEKPPRITLQRPAQMILLRIVELVA